jgi:glucan endo-1,3-beta-D-glucosidase
VWITEAGWPVSGPTENQAVASVENSKTYWDELGCELFNNYNVWWYILRDNNASPAPNPSFGIVGIDLEEPLFDLTCPTGSSGAAASTVRATTNGTASASSTLIANGTVASNVSTENANITSERTNLSCTNQKANLTEASNTTDSSPPAAHSSHSTSSIFSDDMPEILKSLPAIVAANPSIIKKLPSLLNANPDLMKQVEGLNFTEMAADYNVAPIYVTMLQDAIEKAKKDHPTDIVHGAKSIVQILRDGDGS